MPRNFLKNNRGRQLNQGSPRLLKTNDISNDTYQDSTSRTNRGSKKVSKYAAKVQKNKRRRKNTTPITASESSEDYDADDASDEQSDGDDDQDDQPAPLAPSLHGIHAGPGLEIDTEYSVGDRATRVDSPMFELAPSDSEDDDGVDLEDDGLEDGLSAEAAAALFANSDDDEIYEGVNDVSDSEEEQELKVRHHEEQHILTVIADSEVDEMDLLNQIEGMSDCGFGDEAEDAVAYYSSSQDSTSAQEATGRRVRFQIDDFARHRSGLSQSPILSRGLLPSALSPTRGFFEDASGYAQAESSSEDEWHDSDETDIDLPSEAERHDAEQDDDAQDIPRSTAAQNTNGTFNGPRWGVFIDNGDKASGQLDATGKNLIITDPHLLGEEFVRRYANSALSSPGNTFAEILEGSDVTETPDLEAVAPFASVDVMLGNLNAARRDTNGSMTGPQEAFFPLAPGIADYETDLDSDLGEDVINYDNVFQFDDNESEDSDSQVQDASASPAQAPPKTPMANPTNHLYALMDSGNPVTAFRRSADPNFATLKTTPSFQRLAELSSPLPTVGSPTGSRKRKNTNESPYASPHYDGVTPVQRISAHDHAALTAQALLSGNLNNGFAVPTGPVNMRPHKRSRLMSA